MSYKREKDMNVKIVNFVKLLGIEESYLLGYNAVQCSALKVGNIPEDRTLHYCC
jgi:hypothetical protein